MGPANLLRRSRGGIRQPNTPELLVLPEIEGFSALPFLLTRDGCRTLRIRVSPDGTVTVKIPFRVSSGEALRAVVRKRAWIEAKRNFFHSRPQPAPRRYEPGEVFYYLGRPFVLRPEETATAARIPRLPLAQLRGSELVVRGAALTPDRIRCAISAWRHKTDELLFSKRLRRLHQRACQELGDNLPLPALRLRALKRRWGSCARRRSMTTPDISGVHEITLARHLSAAPLEGVDYVILHELCHMRHMNHGPRFHALLARLLPDAPAVARRLHLWGLEHPKD